MDRRQQKTRIAVFNAFSALLMKKKYNRITVQDIIDEANIGRSTFYSHFETKDGLLDAMCQRIFKHVFSEELSEEQSHDFSAKTNTIRHKLTHVLYHIQDNKKDFKALLSCESDALLIHYFSLHLKDVFSDVINCQNYQAPTDYLVNCLVNGFVETVKWWLNCKKTYTPEAIIGFYFSVTALNYCTQDNDCTNDVL